MQTDEEPKNPIISFLESDTTLNIAIVLSFLGLLVMSVFIYLLEGMGRVHMSVVTFLFAGLSGSLLYFKVAKGQSKLNAAVAPTSSKQECKEQ